MFWWQEAVNAAVTGSAAIIGAQHRGHVHSTAHIMALASRSLRSYVRTGARVFLTKTWKRE
jgi:hypothetical protein